MRNWPRWARPSRRSNCRACAIAAACWAACLPNTIFFASIPNLADYLGEAEDVFQQKTAQSPELQPWMQSHGKHMAAVIEKLRAASEYLGGEIVVAVLPKQGRSGLPSEMKRAGFAEFLKQSGLPVVEEERNGLVEFGSPARRS